MKNILFVFGTRPEVIKLVPVIQELKHSAGKYSAILCNTEQQKELSNQALSFFGLAADINLDTMAPNQTPIDAQAAILKKLSGIFQSRHIDAVIVQGDTISAFCGALAGFYNKSPVFHIEAGLRSGNINEPFPEEAARQMLSRIASLHFAPTISAQEALLRENIDQEKIFITGNTAIDALLCLPPSALKRAEIFWKNNGVTPGDKLVLITVHRRENHGDRLDSILAAIRYLADSYPEHCFILPVHPNPNVNIKINHALVNLKNVFLTEPLDYPNLVYLIKNATLILTDSGGIQEEAPTFRVPTLVMRYDTERKEAVDLGFSKLVGADYASITKEASYILDQDPASTGSTPSNNPYGDGNSRYRIIHQMETFFKKNV